MTRACNCPGRENFLPTGVRPGSSRCTGRPRHVCAILPESPLSCWIGNSQNCQMRSSSTLVIFPSGAARGTCCISELHTGLHPGSRSMSISALACHRPRSITSSGLGTHFDCRRFAAESVLQSFRDRAQGQGGKEGESPYQQNRSEDESSQGSGIAGQSPFGGWPAPLGGESPSQG